MNIQMGEPRKTECKKCDKTALCRETPSGFEICEDCWSKESFRVEEFAK